MRWVLSLRCCDRVFTAVRAVAARSAGGGLQADGIAKKALSTDEWDRNKEWSISAGDNKCGTYNTELDAKALGGDVFLGVKCDGGGSLQYVFAQ